MTEETTEAVAAVLERVSWMEWDEKVAVFRGLVAYLGDAFVAEYLRSHPPARPPAPGFEHSAQYWDERYRRRGTSGAGSYGRLAEFKAEVLNRFVRERGVETVIEFGCGDGNQLALAEYPSYVGVDVSPEAVARCRARFAGDATKSFYVTTEQPDLPRRDLALSLDVIYHLVEDDTYEAYMRRLFDAASRYVIVYASNVDAPGPAPHVRHRAFGAWVAGHRPGWRLVGTIPNRYPFDERDPDETSFADFYVYERR
jgi:SAM-dependent methyltransferase